MKENPLEIVRIGRGDRGAVEAAAPLFDGPPTVDATEKFLALETHHLLIAYWAGEPAGFVTGVEVTHPDKGTEMFLYELGVDENFRRRGIGRALVSALAAVARDRDCYGMFVLTAHTNEAAIATYSDAHVVREDGWTMFTWEFADTSRRAADADE